MRKNHEALRIGRQAQIAIQRGIRRFDTNGTRNNRPGWR